MKYPRTLYKKSEKGSLSFTNKEHRDVKYDSLIVKDEKEQRAAEEMGYVDGFEDALFKKNVTPKKTEPKKEEDSSMKIEAGF